MKLVLVAEDELHFYDGANKASIHAAHEEARLALRALLRRLRPGVPAKAKLDCAHQQGFTCCGPGGGPSIK